MRLAGNFQYRQFYFNGRHVAREEYNDWVDHYGLDALGNVHFVIGYNNQFDVSDYYPFGAERVVQSNTNNQYKFTGKERDSESGLDNFDTRYFGSSFGRFMSPDPIGPGQHPENPQSWNLYSYVLNNPVNLVDPTGQYVCAISVTQQQCDNFQKGLDQAQQAANALKDKYGADSEQYKSAQRAIDAYGKEGVDNGVTIAQGNTGNYAAETKVAGNTVAKSADNATGQNILVTLNKSLNLLNGDNTNFLGILGAHEGSHVADASDWVASEFSNNANPSVRQTEFDAYRVGLNVAEGMRFSWTSVSFGNQTYRFDFPLAQPETNNAINLMITREYPRANLDVFSRNTRIKRPQ
jgi:RHS repeat-associated protein